MKYIPSLIIVFFALYYSCHHFKKESNKKDKIILILLTLYFTALFAVTLVPFRPLYHLLTSGWHFNIATRPYYDLRIGHGNAVYESFTNVLMMMPLGFLLKSYSNKPAYQIILFGFCLSLGIETLQLFDYYRVTDITDLINNTIGTAIGVLIYYIYYHIFKERLIA